MVVHLGRVIRDLFRPLLTVLHGKEAVVCSDYPRDATASICLAIILGQIPSSVPWFLSNAGTGVNLGKALSYRQ